LKGEMLLYIELSQILIAEFEQEGFSNNADLVNRRIISLVQSKAMLDNTIAMMDMNKQKCDLFIDNIDNVVNIMVPMLLNKMSLTSDANSSSDYSDLSEEIVNKLRKQ